MAEFSQFDEHSERRIDRAVNAVERTRPDALTRRQADPEHAAGFWVQLTAEGTGGNAGWYSWKLVRRVPASASGWEDASPAVTGTLNLREASGTTGLYSASATRRVFATLNGYNASGQLVYLFESAGSPLAPGTLQYQVLQMLTNTTYGWDWVRAHT